MGEESASSGQGAGFCFTEMGFARTIFKAKGRCPLGTGTGDFYLREEKTGKLLPIPDVQIRGESFDLELATLACNGEAPLQTGYWYVCAGKPEEASGLCHLKVTDTLYDRIMQFEESDVPLDLIIDRDKDNYFHIFSRLREEDLAFYFRVEYEVPEEILSVWKLWKRNLKLRQQERISFLRKKVFAIIFRFFNTVVKKNGKRVLFTSDSRKSISGNEEFVYRRMLERGMDRTYEFRFDFKPVIGAHRSMKNKILFTYYLATSDYIFTDDYQPELYHCSFDGNVRVIQLWHACGAFKTVGFERLGAQGAPEFNTRIHKCYTHVIVSSEHSARHNAEAFAIDRKKFYAVGIPRTDIFFGATYREKAIRQMQEAFPQIRSAKRVILYAPTFRGVNARDAFFPMQVLHFEKIGEYLKQTDSVMIIKMHPFVKEQLKIPEAYRAYFVDGGAYREVNDMLFVTDLLITDYSSVIYEASLLHIPMIFYAFDYRQYLSERGFYEPFEEIVPGKIVRNLKDLIRALDEEDYESEKLEGFIEKNFTYTDGRSTDRVIDLIFGEDCAQKDMEAE